MQASIVAYRNGDSISSRTPARTAGVAIVTAVSLAMVGSVNAQPRYYQMQINNLPYTESRSAKKISIVIDVPDTQNAPYRKSFNIKPSSFTINKNPSSKLLTPDVYDVLS